MGLIMGLMAGKIEKILTSERFKNVASVLPILMGLIPHYNASYFDLRESIITKTKKRAVKIFEDEKIRRADLLMVKAQEQDRRLEEDKDYIENFAKRVEFAQKPLKKRYMQMSFDLGVKRKAEVLKSDEEIIFEKKMAKAQNEIMKTINKNQWQKNK